MNLLQLKYFNAVCETGTVSRAAELLHIAQPSLSVAIKELENEFGTVLFRRTHKGMALTAEGQRLWSFSRDIIERVGEAERAMRELGHEKKSLRLGIPPMIGSLVLPEVYGSFLSENTDIILDIAECGREEMLRRLAEGALDMAFISHGDEKDTSLSRLPVGTLELVAACAEGSEIQKNSAVTAKDLENIPLVMFKDGFFQTHEIKEWFSEAGVTPSILTKTDQLSTVTRVIREGIAVGFLFRPLAESESGIAFAPLSPSLSVHIALVWRRDKYLSAAMHRLKDFLEQHKSF